MSEQVFAEISKLYSDSVVRRLRRFAPEQCAWLGSWLLKYPIGTNYALQILEQAEDLLKKERQTLQKIFDEELAGLDLRRLQSKELGKRLRDLFEKRLHPYRRSHEEAFQTFVKKLGLNPECELIPPQNFEGSIFHLKIAFDSPEGLLQSLEVLREQLQTRDWSPLKDF